MKRAITLISTLMLLSGCADKNTIDEPIKNEILAYTQKSEIIKDKYRALIIATYINPVKKTKDNDESFILSINPKNAEILADSISINSDKNIKISQIDENDKNLENIGFNLPWSRHYIVRSQKKDSDKLELSLSIKVCETCPSEQVYLSFQKVAKSLYWNR